MFYLLIAEFFVVLAFVNYFHIILDRTKKRKRDQVKESKKDS